MNNTLTYIAASVLALSIAMPSVAQTTTSGDNPRDIQRAIAKLDEATAIMMQGGRNWHGYRNDAIAKVNQAREDLHKALVFYNNNAPNK